MRTSLFFRALLLVAFSSLPLAAQSEPGKGGVPDTGPITGLQPGNAPLDNPPPPLERPKSLANGLYMTGQFTYLFSGSNVSVTLDGINNDSFTTTTGTLRLELWASLTYPARGDTNWLGYRLATFATLNPLQPRTSYSNIAQSATYTAPPAGQYWLVFILEQHDSVNCSALDNFYCTQDTFNSFHQASWGAVTPAGLLVGISTRGLVQTGNNVLIGGFIIQGSTPQTVVVRARGPSLAAFGITNPLSDPTLQLVRSSDQVTIATNDDWGNAANASQLSASGFAPSNPLESAILIRLDPGAYTAIVSGFNGATGVGIIEVFAD